MELLRGIHNIRDRHRGCVLTIGAFEGVHLGHRAVLGHLVARGREEGLPSVVVTLEPLPREYFAPVQAPARITSFREKYELLRALDIDRVLLIRFDQQLQRMEAEEFITQVFVEKLGARHVVVGDDVRFGHDGRGDFTLLRSLGVEHGFTVEDTATLMLAEQRVSSTRIRQLLEQGDFIAAEALLGRPYSITGHVVYGKQLGRTIGIPTANIALNRLRAAMSGVYAVVVKGVKGQERGLAGVANVGTRPTINDLIEAILEVHLLDFNDDLYGQRLCVEFHHKIRDEQKFASLDILQQHIQRDIDKARDYFAAR